MLESRSFRKGGFLETDEGYVRLRAPLTHELVETMPRWARALAPVAGRVAHMQRQTMEGKYVPVTPLTTAKQRAAQAAVKAHKAEAVGRQPAGRRHTARGRNATVRGRRAAARGGRARLAARRAGGYERNGPMAHRRRGATIP